MVESYQVGIFPDENTHYISEYYHLYLLYWFPINNDDSFLPGDPIHIVLAYVYTVCAVVYCRSPYCTSPVYDFVHHPTYTSYFLLGLILL